MNNDVATHAENAYQKFCEGLARGQWQEFFDLLAEEVDFLWPYPPAAGYYTGAEGRKKAIEFFGYLGGEGNRISDVTVTGVSVAEDRVIFEDRSGGVMGGQPYEGRHCIHLIMRGEKVVGFHEYTASAA